MKPTYYRFPVIGVIVLAILSGIVFVSNSVSSMHQFLTYLVLFVLLVLMRTDRTQPGRETSEPSVPSDPDDPRSFELNLKEYLAKRLDEFRLVPETLTVPGPMLPQPTMSVMPPAEVDLYIVTSECLPIVVFNVASFFHEKLHCDIVEPRQPRDDCGMTQRLEFVRSASACRYSVVISDITNIAWHFRIQVGRITPDP